MEKFTRSSKHLYAFFLLVCLALFSAKSTAPTLHLVHKKKYVMGTVFEVAVYSPSVERATEAIEKALEEVVRLDGVLSNFKSSSELSQLTTLLIFMRKPFLLTYTGPSKSPCIIRGSQAGSLTSV